MEIVVRGSQFHSAMLVTQLAVSGFDVPIRWVPNHPPFQSWDFLGLDGFKLDNGHHSMELPRAFELVNFIRSHNLVDLSESKGQDYLYIQGFLIPSDAKWSDWPSELKNDIAGSDTIIFENIAQLDLRLSGVLKASLMQIAGRYGGNWDAVRHLVVPWFLPSNFGLMSLDEGDAQRNLVAAQLSSKTRIRPRPPLVFADLGINWTRFLEARPGLKIDSAMRQPWSTRSPHLELMRDTEFDLKDSLIVKNVDPKKPVFSITLAELGAQGGLELSGELLVASTDIPEIARVWSLANQERNLIVIEAFHRDGWGPAVRRRLIDQIHGGLSTAISVASRELEIRGMVASRNYGLGSGAKMEAVVRTGFSLRRDLNQINITSHSLGPINMSKGWRLATNMMARIEEEL